MSSHIPSLVWLPQAYTSQATGPEKAVVVVLAGSEVLCAKLRYSVVPAWDNLPSPKK